MRLLSIIFSVVLLAFANAANAQLSLDAARGKCAELGFKSGTEQFGKCVLQLSKVEEVKPAPQQIQPPVQTYTPPVQTYTPPAQTYSPPQCVGGVASWNNCIGTYTWPDGIKYVGEFRDGKIHGQGTTTLPNGWKYVGEYKDYKPNGQGTATWPDGGKHIGEFRDGKPNGQGTHTRPDGSVIHSGMWADGKPAPQQIQPPVQTYTPPVQTYTPPVQTYTPSQCVGDIASWNNCIGTFTLPDGGKYVGEFRDGKYHGQGTATWPSGQKYVGEFRDGKMHGQGTLTRPSGVKYVGEFRDDKMHGQGTGYNPNGSVFHSGQWLNGAPVK